MFQLYLNAFITLIVISNPVGAAAIFTGLMTGRDSQNMKRTAIKAVTVASLLLVFFALIGEPLLAKLGISIPAFRIAGGVLLFVTAFKMLFGENEAETVHEEKENYIDRYDVAIFPLAIPLLTGPGCITAIILLASRAQGYGDLAIIMAAILSSGIIALSCLLIASPIQRIIGKDGSNILARVLGVILSAMAVQFIADGIRGMNFSFAG